MLRAMLSASFFLALAQPALAIDVSGKASVIDGDTLEIGTVTVRLLGIDAAESGQRCIGEGRKIVRPGDNAATRLMELSTGTVTCSGSGHDDYGRLLAHCTTEDGISINETLVREGLAWAFVKYSAEYAKQEQVAKSSKSGVWVLACEPPWTFREKRWAVAEQKSPNGCPIKGNISANGHIYHTPWSRHYTRTKVDTKRGERWFCSEAEALAAGFRPPRR